MQANPLRCICCYCKRLIHDGPLSPEGWISHGCCRQCLDVQMAELNRLFPSEEAA